MRNHVMWQNPRPKLTIELAGGGQLGNCYYGSEYMITSLYPLDRKSITALRDAGFISHGQEFYIRGQLVDEKLVSVPEVMDWQIARTIQPSGTDFVDPIVVDQVTGKRIPGAEPINEYSGIRYKPMDMPYYVYLVEVRVDSSD